MSDRGQDQPVSQHTHGAADVGHVPRNDVIRLLMERFPDSPQLPQLLASMTDEALDEEFEGDRAELLAMRADFDDACNKMVELGGGKLHFLGEKPAPGDNVYLIDLPDSSVIIRLSDGGLERGHQFLLDFVDRDSRKPDHMPQSYAIWRLYNGPCSPAMHQLMSWEAAMGMPEDQIAPGEQRFSVIEGVTYRVEYLGATPVEFTVPERPRAGPAVHIVPLATTAK